MIYTTVLYIIFAGVLKAFSIFELTSCILFAPGYLSYIGNHSPGKTSSNI